MFSYKLGLIFIYSLIIFGTVDRIQKALEKKEYEKASELIIKGLEKEPLNPGISYYQAFLLFDREFQNYNLDSARLTISAARDKYENADASMLDDLNEDGITKEKIQKLFDQIRDRSFQNTLTDLSIVSAKEYQKKFPKSVYDNILNYKIDSMNFLSARQLKTQKALIDFIRKNPASVFKPQADVLLDDMRMADLERNGNLRDYYDFLEKYPLTSHRISIEKYILKFSTASGTAEKLHDFILLSQVDQLKKKAANVAFYIDENNTSFHPNLDSLSRAIELREVSLLPVVERELIGFYDSNGGVRIPPNYNTLAERYKCQLVSDDWVFVIEGDEGQVLAKDGTNLINNVQQYKSLSSGIGFVKRNENWFLYHKSGFPILNESIEDAEVMENGWIKVKKNDKWGLISVLGLRIAESKYNDIYRLGNFWVFEKDDLLAVYTKKLILDEIEQRGLSLEFKFDDIELVNKHTLIGFRGERECLLDSSLNFLIPWGNYEIYPEKSGWYLKSDKGYKLYNKSEEEVIDKHFEYLESNDGWLAIQMEKDWMLIPNQRNLQPSHGYDSIKLINEYACILFTSDDTDLLFTSGEKIPLEEKDVSTFPLRPEFLMLKGKSTIELFDRNGASLITGDFNEVSFLNDSIIKVQVGSKQGLIKTDGEWVLNPLFESIDEKDGLILTLLNGRIGSYDLTTNELIEANYEARITRIKNYYLTKKDGKFGLVDANENEVLSFSYDEIQLWNDTSYLVKKEDSYLILNDHEKPVYTPIENLENLVQNESQAIYSFIADGRYGLISNVYGELLVPEFTDIFNIGSNESPLFFADQHLSKAGYHVVSYVNQRGDLIMSRAYTKKEFDKILCDN